MKIKVLYEDKDILAIEKPWGISVHPAVEQAHYGAGADGKKKETFITSWIIKNYPKMKGVGEPMGEIDRPGIVHRLDRGTSGVMLLAKNQKAHEFLKNQFMGRDIKKTYVAIVDGWVKEDRGVINKPIGRSPSDFRRRLAGRGARGEMREAITEYKVLKRLEITTPKPLLNKEGRKFTYLELKPKTGRTHQIRVHMKFLNHPVAGDALYNPKSSPLLRLPFAGEEKKGIRMFLHAKSIEFKDMKGKTVKIESKIPKEFEKVIK
ncbi:RluA family pseudouridine synthase [Candidatus Nomurabacteria bacterium]|nr:RluA family pseudouridine synthase [Candidatus Nomurabacteria bacterium]